MQDTFDIHKWKTYQMFLNESDDNFDTVNVPEEWNVTELGVNKVITSDMLNPKGEDYEWFKSNSPFTIEAIYDDGGWTAYLKRNVDSPFQHVDFLLDYLNNSVLNSKYRIYIPDDLLEINDDFNDIKVSDDWNQKDLQVGDYFNERVGEVYTSKEDIPQEHKLFTYEILYIGPNEGEHYKPAYFNHNIIAFRHAYNPVNTYVFTVDHFNDTRGPKLNAYIDLFNKMVESNDDFDFTDTDKDLASNLNSGVIELGIKDIITPNMFKHNDDFFNNSLSFSILDIQDQTVFLEIIDSDVPSLIGSKFTLFTYELDDLLKPKFMIDNTISESNDFDFTSTDTDLASSLANEIILEPGYVFTGDEVKDEKVLKSRLMGKTITKYYTRKSPLLNSPNQIMMGIDGMNGVEIQYILSKFKPNYFIPDEVYSLKLGEEYK